MPVRHAVTAAATRFVAPWASAILLLTGTLPSSGVYGQVIQLPSQSIFSVQTTVSVPDSGRSRLGSVNRARRGVVSRSAGAASKVPGVGRLFGNRAGGAGTSVSGAHVKATIIDHREWDQAVLSAASAADPQTAHKAAFLTRNMARRSSLAIGARTAVDAKLASGAATPQRAVSSVGQIRRRIELSDAQRREQALNLLHKARQAEAAGKPGVARIYYRMAASRADQQLRKELLAGTGQNAPETAAGLAISRK